MHPAEDSASVGKGSSEVSVKQGGGHGPNVGSGGHSVIGDNVDGGLAGADGGAGAQLRASPYSCVNHVPVRWGVAASEGLRSVSPIKVTGTRGNSPD